VPLGAVGELYLGGAGLARGYWGRPTLTAERFIAHPFMSGERLYRTGDLARYRADGALLCLGRLDDQVKVHGVRVELGEVEAALRGVAGVRDAVVTAWTDARGDTQLVGHLVAGEPAPAPAVIRAQLRERLPEVMIPLQFLFTDAFPQTANGKVQRSALATPGTTPVAAAAPALAPETPTERQLAAAWAQVLNVDLGLIGRDSDFMDLGGHSLLMTSLMLEIRQRFQVRFTLREFFDAPTLRQFAALIDARRQAQISQQPDSRPARTAEWGRQRMAFLLREADLPPTLTPARGMRYQPGPYDKVLLTGGTGFLGAYLIAEILETTTAQVYCLVRPKRGEDGKARIERQMRHYAVWRHDERWRQAWDTRVQVVDGDVTLPRLGLADATYETLARDIDAILHGAAHVNFIYPYEALRGTNVIGIHEIIRFAFDTRIKPVHHLSTAAIWPMGAQYTFYEKDPIEHGQVLNLGYDEAKWVGERCLLNAQERGLPVARYRPGEVGGDSVTGRCVTDHFLIASIKGFLQFGAFPALDINVDVAPVDYVSKAMIHLMFKRNALGRAFHLTNPQPRPMREALGFLRGLGYRFDELRFVELRDRLVNSRHFAANALFAYQATLEDMDDTSLQLPTYDTRQTQRELRPAGIVCPAADEKLFGLYLRYLQAIDFIPAPAGWPAPV
jgi:thioester reductase-like protein